MIKDNQLVIIWGIDDVQQIAKDNYNAHILPEDALAILEKIDRHHDCSIGINWDVIDFGVDDFLTEVANNLK